MSKLPTLKRLQLSDLQGFSEWIRPFVIMVNNYFQNVWDALNQNLTFQDNIRSQIIEIDYVGGSSLNIGTNLTQPVMGILVLQTKLADLTGGVTIQWQQIENVIEIKQITGLAAGQQYKLRLLLV